MWQVRGAGEALVMPAYVDIPDRADLVLASNGRVLEGRSVNLKVADTDTDATHYADRNGTDPQTTPLVVRADGTIGTASARRYVRSGVALDAFGPRGTVRLEPVAAFDAAAVESVESDIAVIRSTEGRIPSTEAEAAMRASLATASAGDTVDLGGLKHTLTSKLTVPAGVKVVNFDITAGNHTALELAAGAVLARGRVTRGNTGGSTGADKSNIVVAADDCQILDVDPVGAMLANLYIAHNINNVTVRGGTFKNTSQIQNACAIYAQGFVVGEDHDRITVEGIRLDPAWASPDGILLFDTSRAIVRGNRIKGLRQLPTVTLTGWTVVSGNIYKATERTDGNTRDIRNNGVQVNENTSTPTTPGANEWGIGLDGFVYLNLNGTDPNTRTITSNIVGGYAITLYSANDLVDMNYNLVAHNDIEDVDGFGIYFQMSSGSHGNKSDHNTLKDVAKTGLQSLPLPHSAIACTRGYDYELSGDLIDGSGYEGFWFCNAAEGVVVGATARACTRSGFKAQTSDWIHQACKSYSNTIHGFDCRTVSGDSFINLEYSACRAISNTSNGLSADASSGGGLSVQIVGGVYRNNGGHGVALAVCTNSHVSGVKTYNNTGQQINQSGGSSARVTIDGYNIPAGGNGIAIAGGTDIKIGRGANNATTKWTFSGSTPAVLDIVGSGTPESVIAGAIGSRFARTDGGAATSIYVKESGTGNTGWVGK